MSECIGIFVILLVTKVNLFILIIFTSFQNRKSILRAYILEFESRTKIYNTYNVFLNAIFFEKKAQIRFDSDFSFYNDYNPSYSKLSNLRGSRILITYINNVLKFFSLMGETNRNY